MNLNDQLRGLSESVTFIVPEIILLAGLCVVLLLSLASRKNGLIISITTVAVCVASATSVVLAWPGRPVSLFAGMLRFDDFSCFWKLLFDIGGILFVFMTDRNKLQKAGEYYLLALTIVLGAHSLVMSMNFITVALSLELISLSSYALAGWSFTKESTEGSLKYFLFGSIATAAMLYGMSLIYGLAGTLDFSSERFVNSLMDTRSPLLLIAGVLTLGGFLFKMGSAPMHFWTPDVYQSASTPVVAFISVVPKIAGLAALIKFILSINLFGQSTVEWPILLALIASQSIAFGNLSALGQSNPKRMLAYSSIAQSGFLLVGVVPVSITGVHAVMFYAAILLLMNFLCFFCLQQFERDGVTTISSFSGLGRNGSLKSIALTIGLISLVGLPITAGFNAKLFVFSGLWESYSQTNELLVILLLVFGLLNTVISVFYYLKIPYYLFLREAPTDRAVPSKIRPSENLLSLILVLLLLILFFRPDLLMRWIIRVNFVL